MDVRNHFSHQDHTTATRQTDSGWPQRRGGSSGGGSACLPPATPRQVRAPRRGSSSSSSGGGSLSTLRCCCIRSCSGNSSSELLYGGQSDRQADGEQSRVGAGACKSSSSAAAAANPASSSSAIGSGGEAGCGGASSRSCTSPLKDVLWQVGCVCRSSCSNGGGSSSSTGSRLRSGELAEEFGWPLAACTCWSGVPPLTPLLPPAPSPPQQQRFCRAEPTSEISVPTKVSKQQQSQWQEPRRETNMESTQPLPWLAYVSAADAVRPMPILGAAATAAADPVMAARCFRRATAVECDLLADDDQAGSRPACTRRAEYCGSKLCDRLSDYEDIWDSSSSSDGEGEAAAATTAAANLTCPASSPATSSARHVTPAAASLHACTSTGTEPPASMVLPPHGGAGNAPWTLPESSLPAEPCLPLQPVQQARRSRVGSVPAVIVSKLSERVPVRRRLSLGVVRQSSRQSLKSHSNSSGAVAALAAATAQHPKKPTHILRRQSSWNAQQQQQQRCDIIRGRRDLVASNRGCVVRMATGTGTLEASMLEAASSYDARCTAGDPPTEPRSVADFTLITEPAGSRMSDTKNAVLAHDGFVNGRPEPRRHLNKTAFENVAEWRRPEPDDWLPSALTGLGSFKESHRPATTPFQLQQRAAHCAGVPAAAPSARNLVRARSFQEKESGSGAVHGGGSCCIGGMRQHIQQQHRRRRQTVPPTLPKQPAAAAAGANADAAAPTSDSEPPMLQVRCNTRRATTEDDDDDEGEDRLLACLQAIAAGESDGGTQWRQQQQHSCCPKFPLHLNLEGSSRRTRRCRADGVGGGGGNGSSSSSSSSSSQESLTLLDVIQSQLPEYSFEPISALTPSNLQRLSTYDNLPSAATAGHRLSVGSYGSTVFSKPWDVGPAEELLRTATDVAATAASSASIGAVPAASAAAAAATAAAGSNCRPLSFTVRSCSSQESFGIQMRSISGGGDDDDEASDGLSFEHADEMADHSNEGRDAGSSCRTLVKGACIPAATAATTAVLLLQRARDGADIDDQTVSVAAMGMPSVASPSETTLEPLFALEGCHDTTIVESDQESMGISSAFDCSRGVACSYRRSPLLPLSSSSSAHAATVAGTAAAGVGVPCSCCGSGGGGGGGGGGAAVGLSSAPCSAAAVSATVGATRRHSEEADSGTELDSSMDNVYQAKKAVSAAPCIGGQEVEQPMFNLCKNSQASLQDFSQRVKQMRSPKLSKRRTLAQACRQVHPDDGTNEATASTANETVVQPSTAIRELVCRLAHDRDTMFGDAVHQFIHCTQESTEGNPRILLSNVRQFMTGIKNFLMNHGEPSLDQLLQDEKLKLDACEFLNVDAILEGALLKCVALPLKPVIYRAFVSFFNKNGSLKAVADGIRAARSKSMPELGLRGCFSASQGRTLECVKTYFVKMQNTYSPIKKLESLLSACSEVYNVIGCSNDRFVDKACRHDSCHSKWTLAEADFLMMLAYVLVQCGAVHAEIEAEYMRGLLPSALSCGEGAYYITTLNSVVTIIKRMGCLEPPASSISPGPSGRSLLNTLGFVKVYVPDEATNSIVSMIMPTCSTITVREICAMVSHKLFITNPQDYTICIIENGKESKLADNETLGSVVLNRPGHSIAFKRTTAQIIWPSVLD